VEKYNLCCCIPSKNFLSCILQCITVQKKILNIFREKKTSQHKKKHFVYRCLQNVSKIVKKYFNFCRKKYYHFSTVWHLFMTSQFNYSRCIISKLRVHKSAKSTNHRFINMSIMISTVQMFNCVRRQFNLSILSSLTFRNQVFSQSTSHQPVNNSFNSFPRFWRQFNPSIIL